MNKSIKPESEYYQEWLNGQHKTDYNNCRFSDNKLEYAKHWLDVNVPFVNYENPQNIVDRICNYKLYDKNIEKQYWTDKYQALTKLKVLGFTELIIEPIICGTKDTFKDDFKTIPNGNYILRMNNGSGWNMKFEKTDSFNPEYLYSKVEEWSFLNYAYICGYEWQYENIKPMYIIQPDLGNLMNWEFWCENGEIVAINLVKKLGKNLEGYLSWTDCDGNYLDWYIGNPGIRNSLSKDQKVILEKMKPYVLKLCSGFKFVRVDLYYINNNIKFSELTFTPCSGKLNLRNKDE